MATAVGIDLGTAYSCVALFQNGKVEIIPNERGNRITPSYIAFTDGGRLIGDAAKNQITSNPNNTIFNTKRLIGRKFDDASLRTDMTHWPFKVVNYVGKPKILVEYKNETKLFTPEEISSMILIKMKDMAETYLGKKITEAVITVPVSFNHSQWEATKNAGVIAGLDVLRILSETTAVAIAYTLDKNVSGEKNLCIFDLGAGTFNVSIVIIEEGIIDVKSVAGDTHLGGIDFDNQMVAHFVQEFKRKHNKDLLQNKRSIQRLRTACESAKVNSEYLFFFLWHTLSTSFQASIELESLHEGIDFYSTIARTCFEEMNAHLFRLTPDLVEKALRDAKMDKSSIHDIILNGGSTRIPQIQKLLQEFFNNKELNKSLHPGEAVAYGAAIQAAILTGDNSKKTRDMLLLDVAPFSVGIETTGEVMTALIKRNTTIPTKQTKTFTIKSYTQSNNIVTELVICDKPIPTKGTKTATTSSDKQVSVDIKIFEGEHSSTRYNHFLDSFTLSGISSASMTIPQIQVTFDINANGILVVSAVDKTSGQENKITVTNDKERLSKYEIEYMIADAEKFRREDETQDERILAKNSLEEYCFNIKATINDKQSTDKIDNYDMKKMIFTIEDAMEWLETNHFAVKEELEQKLKKIKGICSPILEKFR
ncbi:unnamed protein product [Adineta steineri]|uniref:Uncharacterized protein n=1 Tax=Adineta steineri TaxID=433720 RepID=A0A819QQG4_9BILA|nr:unnamed protein product [Adineta steineri]CAF4035059.1 unnamed protein product [Adineta steineri]